MSDTRRANRNMTLKLLAFALPLGIDSFAVAVAAAIGAQA